MVSGYRSTLGYCRCSKQLTFSVKAGMMENVAAARIATPMNLGSFVAKVSTLNWLWSDVDTGRLTVP